MEPNWSQNRAKMEPKSNQNGVKNLGDSKAPTNRPQNGFENDFLGRSHTLHDMLARPVPVFAIFKSFLATILGSQKRSKIVSKLNTKKDTPTINLRTDF